MFKKLYYKYLYNPSNFNLSLSYDDVYLYQQKNICDSRLHTNVSSELFRGFYINYPLIPANMLDIINPEYIKLVSNLGSFGIMHRAFSDKHDLETNLKTLKYNKKMYHNHFGASVGVGENAYSEAISYYKQGADVICIDVAHGYSDQVIDLAKNLKSYSKGLKLIVGNVMNHKFLFEIDKYADAVKVGIGQGAACTTKNVAGCHEPTFQSIYRLSKVAKVLGMPLIADGGVRQPKDFVLAIAAGASTVMSAYAFAQCEDSPAFVSNHSGSTYSGMSSKEVQDRWNKGLKSGLTPEGTTINVPVTFSTTKEMLDTYIGGLRSGLTYSGVDNIKDLHKKAKFIRVTK